MSLGSRIRTLPSLQTTIGWESFLWRSTAFLTAVLIAWSISVPSSNKASISISSNIAEGFERNTDKEFLYFLFIAKASAGEVRSQLYLALDLNYITKIEFDELFEDVSDISKLISGFIKYLNKS